MSLWIKSDLQLLWELIYLCLNIGKAATLKNFIQLKAFFRYSFCLWSLKK